MHTARHRRSQSPRSHRLATLNSMTRDELAVEFFNLHRTIPMGLSKRELVNQLMADFNDRRSPSPRRRSPSPRRRSPSPRRRSPSPRRRSPSPRRRSPSPRRRSPSPRRRSPSPRRRSPSPRRRSPSPVMRRQPVVPFPIQHLNNIPLNRRRGSR